MNNNLVQEPIVEQFDAEEPAPQEEQGEQAAHSTENLLSCIMGDGCDLHEFQEYEVYFFNSGSDCDVPEDDFSDDETMEDVSINEDEPPIPITLPEEDNPAEEVQPSPGNVQEEDNLVIGFQVAPENLPEEENKSSSVNLHVTLVIQNLQVTADDPSTPRQLAVNVETFEGVYSEPDQDKIPGIHMDVQVQTVIATAAEEGESNCSSRILMDIQLDQKTEPDTCEHSEAMKESSEMGVNEASLVDVIEDGAFR